MGVLVRLTTAGASDAPACIHDGKRRKNAHANHSITNLKFVNKTNSTTMPVPASLVDTLHTRQLGPGHCADPPHGVCPHDP